MEKKFLSIVTRFAPSPTGNLHVGGARTAIFNYLFSKKKSGKFIFRIEDTDQLRSFEHYAKSQYDDLCWLGILPDESSFSEENSFLYRQTERVFIYKSYIKTLLDKKKAYFCFCSKLELQKEKENYFLYNGKKNYKYSRKCLALNEEEVLKNIKNEKTFLIRFFVDNEKDYVVKDGVRGLVKFSGKDIEDFVISRKNWVPLLNFAVVVDDHEMKVSHIIRAEEHLPNTAKQIAIYEAFSWNIPEFFHISIIINSERKKISKRDKENKFFTVKNLKEMGYLPEAINNYLMFLGWSPSDFENEVFSKTEMIEKFDERRLSSRPSVFSIEKLNWFNGQWIKRISNEYFDKIAKEFVEEFYQEKYDKNLKTVARSFKNQIQCFSDLPSLMKVYFFKENFLFYEKINLNIKSFVYSVFENLVLIENWSEELIKVKIQEILFKLEKNQKKEFLVSLRFFLTGVEKGPEINKIIHLKGKERVEKIFSEIRKFNEREQKIH